MKRTFIETPAFTKKWKQLGFNDDMLRQLEMELLQNPKAGDVIQGTGKLRKIRVAFEHTGKSGGSRVCYVDFEVKETIYLINVYSKNEKENLSKDERNLLKKVIIQIEENL